MFFRINYELLVNYTVNVSSLFQKQVYRPSKYHFQRKELVSGTN